MGRVFVQRVDKLLCDVEKILITGAAIIKDNNWHSTGCRLLQVCIVPHHRLQDRASILFSDAVMPLAVIQIAQADHINEDIGPRTHYLGLFEDTSRPSQEVREPHDGVLFCLRGDQDPVASRKRIPCHQAQVNRAIKKNEIVPRTKSRKFPPEPCPGLQYAFIEISKLVVRGEEVEPRDLSNIMNDERF